MSERYEVLDVINNLQLAICDSREEAIKIAMQIFGFSENILRDRKILVRTYLGDDASHVSAQPVAYEVKETVYDRPYSMMMWHTETSKWAYTGDIRTVFTGMGLAVVSLLLALLSVVLR